jgi:cell division protein FtsL
MGLSNFRAAKKCLHRQQKDRVAHGKVRKTFTRLSPLEKTLILTSTVTVTVTVF